MKGITEVASVILSLLAAIETVARAIFIGFAFLYSKIKKDDIAFNKSVALLKSSAFTVAWNIRNLYHNIKEEKLPTQEHEARSFFKTLSTK